MNPASTIVRAPARSILQSAQITNPAIQLISVTIRISTIDAVSATPSNAGQRRRINTPLPPLNITSSSSSASEN